MTDSVLKGPLYQGSANPCEVYDGNGYRVATCPTPEHAAAGDDVPPILWNMRPGEITEESWKWAEGVIDRVQKDRAALTREKTDG